MKRRLNAPALVLLLLCLMYFLTYIDRVNVATAGPQIQKDFNLSNTQLGLVFSGFAYPYALFQVLGGWLGDRLGPRRTLVLCGAIWAVATALTGLAVGLVSLMFFRVALGFGEGATFPTATRAMQSWTPTGLRGFAQGVTHSFARLGNAVTPPIVAWLMIWMGWRGAISDYLLHRTKNVTFARLSVILVGFLGAAGCLLPVLFSRDVVTLTLCLAGGFFFLGLIIGYIVDTTGNWHLPFVGSIVLVLVGSVLAFTMHPARKFVDAT